MRSTRTTMPAAQQPGPQGRLRWVGFLFAAFFVVVVGRLVWLQVINGPALASEAAAHHTNVVTVHAKRGTIYDRNGNVLAMSADCKTLYCNPSEVTSPSKVAKILAADLGGEESDYIDILEQDTTFAYLYQKADTELANKVADDLEEAKLTGVYYLDDTKRVYPYGAVGGQVLGLVGTDGDGLSGLEYTYNDILKGSDGEMRLESGADGTPIAGGTSEITRAKNGTDIIVSLDINVQEVAERAIADGVTTYEADSGSVVVTKPTTGEILAIVSTPTFDPADLSTVTNESLLIKPVTNSYEPGSIFKILTLTIGLENEVINPESTFTVPPEVTVGDDTVTDDDDRDYTLDMTVREIIRRSSNTGTVMIARSIGADNFAKGVKKFGIGSRTGIDLPGEATGIVTERDDYLGNTLGAMSFGQALSVPMIQMVRAVGAVANEGVSTTPHLLLAKNGEEVSWKDGKRVCSKKTAATVTDILRGVVSDGTGSEGAVAGYDVVGKTGTAEMVDPETGLYSEDKNVSSMIGWANADDPQVLVYVGLNGTRYLAGSSSAHVFSTIMEQTLSIMGVKPTS